MNVKTPYKGCRPRNKYCNPLRVNEENFRFLSVFCDWLELVKLNLPFNQQCIKIDLMHLQEPNC